MLVNRQTYLGQFGETTAYILFETIFYKHYPEFSFGSACKNATSCFVINIGDKGSLSQCRVSSIAC